MSATTRSCRVCGCTDADCRGCIERTGLPCHWVEADLCSACVGLHGPVRCPVAPAGCSVCDGYHHWLEDGFDPENPPWKDDPEGVADGSYARELAVAEYDREHGTDHALAFWGCKHCPAWATDEHVGSLEEDEFDEWEVTGAGDQ